MRSEGSRLLGAVAMTQREIATRLGVGQKTVSRWISGEAVPRIAHREAMRAAFGVPIEGWPDEWAMVRDAVVRILSSKNPALLLEIVEELERMGASFD